MPTHSTRSPGRALFVVVTASVSFAGLFPIGAVAQRSTIVVFDSLVPVGGVPSGRARIALLEEQLLTRPRDYGLRWLAAQEYAQIGLTEPDSKTRFRLWSRSRLHATVAKTLDPDGLEGRYWLAVAAGLIADLSGGRTKVRLADEAYRESAWVLEIDSTHAGAHYLQGRIQAAVMRLSAVMRFIAKALVGGEALRSASWERAEFHLRRAAELEPELAMHHFELAMIYESMDRPEEMHVALRNAVGASVSTSFQEDFKARARHLLGEGRRP